MNLIHLILLQGIGRFRVNVFKQRNSDAIAIRVIALKIPTLDELNYPKVLKGNSQ